jgi:D-alanyl-D-alanine endopeptidase (penicillin-binding protein 7)
VVCSKLKKNWLAIALVSVLSVSVSASVEAATKARTASAQTSKATKVTKATKGIKATKATKGIKAVKAKKYVRKGGVASRGGQLASRARVASFQAAGSGKSANVAALPIIAAAPARASANLAAASSASGTSFGQLYGLHQTQDPLDLKSSVALVMDQDTNEVVFSKNSEAVLPIASLTKLMTAMVMVEARLPQDETITVTSDDVDTEKNSSSRLAVGAVLTRGELLHLALMSSENRAAHALGRTYPGGLPAFIVAMNAKARSLGMADTRYVDPTGLNSGNQSSAKDLASLVKAAYQQPLIRELSISREYAVRVGSRQVQFHNTNSLVRNPAWDIGLQKTGYIVEAGRCLVMQAKMAGRKFIMVFLDSTGKYSRQADAERVRRWIESATQKGALSSLPSNKIQS